MAPYEAPYNFNFQNNNNLFSSIYLPKFITTITQYSIKLDLKLKLLLYY